MQIEAVIIFPNIRGIFDLRRKTPKKSRVGWVTSKWKLILINDKMFWERVRDYDNSYNRYTLSLDKKRIVAKYYNLPIIYLDKGRAKYAISNDQKLDSRVLRDIPFREQDLL